MKKLSIILFSLLFGCVFLTACSSEPQIIEVEVPIPCDKEHFSCNHEECTHCEHDCLLCEIDSLKTESDYLSMLSQLSLITSELETELNILIKAREEEEKRKEEEEKKKEEEKQLEGFRKVNWIKYGDVRLEAILVEDGWVIELTLDGRIGDYGAILENPLSGFGNHTVLQGNSVQTHTDGKMTVEYNVDNIPMFAENINLGDKYYCAHTGSHESAPSGTYSWTVTKKGMQTHLEYYMVKVVDSTKVMIRYPNGEIVEVMASGFEISWVE